jgi:FtsP/CotA-like multicopper oxidase with cupredoxin domain
MNRAPLCKPIVIFFAVLPLCVSDAPTDIEVCPRPASGGLATSPGELRASNGQLHVTFAFRSQVDDYGLTRYCYISGDGAESPALRVNPGDEVALDLKNELPASAADAMRGHLHAPNACAPGPMTAASTNLHFHGLEIPPLCHQDDVIHTLVQPSAPVFQYRFRIPAKQPPGLYRYHPHPHGYTEGQVLGGASGALIVEGIAKLRPELAALPERILILRDQRVPVGSTARSGANDRDDAVGKDLSLNFVPVSYPL